jgi:hypothetical protein
MRRHLVAPVLVSLLCLVAIAGLLTTSLFQSPAQAAAAPLPLSPPQRVEALGIVDNYLGTLAYDCDAFYLSVTPDFVAHPSDVPMAGLSSEQLFANVQNVKDYVPHLFSNVSLGSALIQRDGTITVDVDVSGLDDFMQPWSGRAVAGHWLHQIVLRSSADGTFRVASDTELARSISG